MKRQLTTSLLVSLLLGGCGSDSRLDVPPLIPTSTQTLTTSTASSSTTLAPAPAPQPVVLDATRASAAATDVLAEGSVNFFRAQATDQSSALPDASVSSPNNTALSLALAVTLNRSGQLISPLGGSCEIDNEAARFLNLRTATATVSGTIQFQSAPAAADPAAQTTVVFHDVKVSQGSQTLTINGPAQLTVSDGGGAQTVTWVSNCTTVSGSRRIGFDDWTVVTRVQQQLATQEIQGRLIVQAARGLDGVLTVTTPTPVRLAEGKLTAGVVSIAGVGEVQLKSLQPLKNLFELSCNGSPVKLVSWGYLGGLREILPAVEPLRADTILTNANILTMEDGQPRAQALAIRRGRLLRVGSEAQVAVFASPDTRQLDMGGKSVLPGFLEPHMHYDLQALHLSAQAHRNADGVVPANTRLVDCGLYDFHNPAQQEKSKASVLQALAGAVADNPNAHAIFGFNYDPSRLQEADLFKNLTRQELDQISSTIPIVVQNASGHISYANSAAFRQAKVNGQTVWPTAPNAPFQPPPDAPPFRGSDIVLDPQTGLPTGQLDEQAQDAFIALAALGALQGNTPLTEALPFLNYLRNYRTLQEQLGERGITTAVWILVGAGQTMSVDAEEGIVAELEARVDCPVRSLLYVNSDLDANGLDVFAGEGNDRLRVVGAKFITDGSTQGFTAGLNFNYLQPVVDFVFPAGLQGLLNFADAATLAMKILPYYQKGFQLAFHANGDRAFRQVVAALKMFPDDIKQRRTRVEHFTVHQPSELQQDVQDCLDLGLYPGHTMGHVFYWGRVFQQRILGADVAQNIDPVGALLSRGVKVSLHSDAPVSPPFPLLFVQTAVNRLYQVPPGQQPAALGPQHAVSVTEALKCVTLYPAQAALMDDQIGSLREGKYADLVVLDADPVTVASSSDPNAISSIQVLQTWLSGQQVPRTRP